MKAGRGFGGGCINGQAEPRHRSPLSLSAHLYISFIVISTYAVARGRGGGLYFFWYCRTQSEQMKGLGARL